MKSLLFIGAVMMMAAVSGATQIQSPVAMPGGWIVREGVKPNLAEQVDVTLALKRRNIDKLEKVLLEVSDPKHPSYGQHWTPEQVRDLITPGKPVIESIKTWLTGSGAQSIKVAKTEDTIRFTATRGELAKMFDIEWSFVQNPKTGIATFSALGAVSVPEQFATEITTVAGLYNFPHPNAKLPKREVGQSGLVTPDEIAKTYNMTEVISSSNNLQSFFQAAGQAVSAADTTYFCQQQLGAGYSGPCSIARYVGGSDGAQPGIESALDSQYILAVGRATTWAYTYNSQDFCNDLTSWAQAVLAEDTFPYVISMSYGAEVFPGYCASIHKNLNEDVMKMGTMGITVVIASGDCGSAYYTRGDSAECNSYNDGYLVPSFPADMPYVTAVGATQFQNGFTGEESASFSGGGFSFTYDMPDYQKDAVDTYMSTLKTKPQGKYNYAANKKGRANPDIALVGVNFDIVVNKNFMTVGGTSCSTPTFGGMVTQLNNIALQANKTMGFINPFLYQNADCFNDITTGNNANGYAGHGWDAIKGWDAATGLGSPNWGCLASRIHGGHIPTQGPTTMAPPTPPTPAPAVTPAPAGGTFTQKICTSSNCTEGCQSHTLPQNQCLSINGGGSAIAVCSATDLTLTEYPLSADCSGFSEKTTQPINQCVKDTSGSYLENLCSNSGPTSAPNAPTTAAPAPVTPAPSGSFTQKVCQNSQCTEGCQSHTFPQNQCLQLNGGGSAKAKCSSEGLTLTEYPLSQDCSGFSIPTTQPVNQCLQDEQGSYLENECSSALVEVQATGSVRSAASKKKRSLKM